VAVALSFSKSELSKIKPSVERIYYSDTKTRSLLLDVTPNGNMSFQIYRKFKGKPKRITLGKFDATLPDTREFPKDFDPLSLLGNSPALNVKMARIMANAVNLQLDSGIDIAQIKRSINEALNDELTLYEAFEFYKAHHLIPNEIKTRDEMEDNFRRYLGEITTGQIKKHGKEKIKPKGSVNWSKRKISTITNEEVSKLLYSLKQSIGAPTSNHVLELIRAIYNYLISKSRFRGINPCQGLKKFKVESRKRFLKETELPTFFNSLELLEDRYKWFFKLSLFTGARKSNVMAMRWSDLDLSRKVWTISANESKNNADMYVALADEAIEILKQIPRINEWVFPASSKSGHMESPKKKWAELLRNAGLQNLTIHDLRRTLGSYAVMTNSSLHITGKLLGHHSSESTKVYAHLQQQTVLDAANKAVDKMVSLSGKSK
jgi:integrase